MPTPNTIAARDDQYADQSKETLASAFREWMAINADYAPQGKVHALVREYQELIMSIDGTKN
jgi:hypothetical protein